MYLVTMKVNGTVEVKPFRTGEDVVKTYLQLMQGKIKDDTRFEFIHIDRYTSMRTLERTKIVFGNDGIYLDKEEA